MIVSGRSVARYVLIESRSPLESPDVQAFLDLAAQLSEAGHDVDVFLVANAVLLASGQLTETLLGLSARERVTLRVDGFSLACRGLEISGHGVEDSSPTGRAPARIEISEMPDLVRLLMQPGTTPVWH